MSDILLVALGRTGSKTLETRCSWLANSEKLIFPFIPHAHRLVVAFAFHFSLSTPPSACTQLSRNSHV